MRYITFCFVLLLIGINAEHLFAQPTKNWYSYYDAKKDLYGYKDRNGAIKIRARFNTLTRAYTFQNIIAVTESNTNDSYYLLKNGQKVGRDSLYVWDMTYDCEQEGTIRFHDPVTDKVGFLGKNGKVVIPATYNDARPFYNGFALVTYNGKRICADGRPYKADSCEHWSWDGITALINRNGIIVADSIDINATENLNWYSCVNKATPADTSLYASFRAKDNSYFSFTNYEKEFKFWFSRNFTTKLQAKFLPLYCFNEITVEGLWKQTLRKSYTKAAFLKQFTKVLQRKIAFIKHHQAETFIIRDDLNLSIYNNKSFKYFYTNCGEPNTAMFPYFDVVASHYNKQHQLSYQEHFSFLRTTNGYKLIGIAIKSRY